MTITNSSAQAFTINSDLLVTSTRGKALTLGGGGAGLNTFAGDIGDVPAPTASSTILAVQKAASATTLTLASVRGIVIGDAISGTNITAGTTVTAINPNTRVVTLSVASGAATTSAGAVITTPNVINSVQINKTGAGTWVLGGTNTYSGGTVLTAGTLQFANLLAMPAIGNVAVANTTTLAVNLGGPGEWTTGTSGNGTIGGLLAGLGGQAGGTITYTGAVTLGFDTTNASPTTQTYTDPIANVGMSLGLRKFGPNTLVLSSANLTYTGATTVTNGTLTYDAASTYSTPAAAGLLLVSGAAAEANLAGIYTVPAGNGNAFFQIQNGGVLNITGTVSLDATVGGGGIRIGEASAGTLNQSAGTLTYTTVSGSNLVIGRSAGASGVLNVTGGTFSVTGAGGTQVSNTAGNSGTITVGGTGTIILNTATIALGTTPTSTATVNLNTGGTLALGVSPTASGMSTFNFAGGTLRAEANIALGGFTVANVRNGGVTFNSNGNTISVGQDLINFLTATTDSVSKTGAGELILTGVNTYTGGTVVSSGVLAADTAAPNSATGTAAVTVTGGTLRGVGNIAGAITLNGGTVAPGDATNAGVLTAASLLASPLMGTMSFDTAGGLVNSSQLVLTAAGNLNLGSAVVLSVPATFAAASDPTHFTLIATHASNTDVLGEFSNFAEGALVTTNTLTGTGYFINYGTFPGEPGNIVLAPSVVPEPAAALVVFTAVVLIRRRRFGIGGSRPVA